MNHFVRVAFCASALIAASLSIASCSQGGGGGGAAPVAPAGGGGGGGGPVPPAPYGLTERVEVTGLEFPTGLPEPGEFDKITVFANLGWGDLPVLLTSALDGTDRLFVVERSGRITTFPNDRQVKVEDMHVFLDIRDRVEFQFEEGLIGLAFDPDYANNGMFYVFYTVHTPARASRVSRFVVSANDPDKADPDSEQIILEFEASRPFHKGGCIAFGKDGMLYIAVGDDQNSATGQDRTDLFGSILRIQPTETGYEIPADNPFVGEGNGVREEIYAYGLRNPWRFSFDRLTGDLWVGDVGDGSREEVDLVRSGDNFGWPVYEGTKSHTNPNGLPLSDFVSPVIEYEHVDGNVAVIGGYVYRGTKWKSLQGAYIYGDYGGNIWALVHDGEKVVSNTKIAFDLTHSSFGEDEAGEIYIVNQNGLVRTLEETSGPPPGEEIPDLLSETGVFTDLANMTPAPGLIEYGLNTPQWADGARIRRWIALPGQERIGFVPDDPWEFPIGTVLILHTEIDLNATTVRRLELRVMVNRASGWLGSIYRWRADGTDADLLAADTSETLVIADPTQPGGEREQTWHFPGPQSCYRCHHDEAGFVIGVKTAQLNGDFAYGEVTDNQLRAWNHIGLFTTDLGDDMSARARLADAWNDEAPLEARARAYLDVNCAHCHQPSTAVPVDIDLRYFTGNDAANVIGVPATHGDLGIAGAERIQAGKKEGSVLWERMRRLDDDRMPPLGTHLVDESAVDLIGKWIDALE